MAKRGDLARESVKNTIIEAFAKDGNYINFLDKKIYVQARDGSNGELIQFAITMTMPKTPVETDAAPAASASASAETMSTAPTTLDPADKEKVAQLKELLGITC